MNNKRQNRRNQGGYYDLGPVIFATEAPVIDPPAPDFAPPEDTPPPPPAHWGQPVPDAAGSGGNQVNELPRAKSGRKAAVQSPEADVPEADPPSPQPQVIYQEPPQRSRGKGVQRSNQSGAAPQSSAGGQQQVVVYPPAAPQYPQNSGTGFGWFRKLFGWLFTESGGAGAGIVEEYQPVWLQIFNIVGGLLIWLWGSALTQRFLYQKFPSLETMSNTRGIPLIEMFPKDGGGLFGWVELHLTTNWMVVIATWALSGGISAVEFMIFKRQSSRGKRIFILIVFGADMYINVVGYIEMFDYRKQFRWQPFFYAKDEIIETGSFIIWLASGMTAVLPEIMLSKGTAPIRRAVAGGQGQGQGRRR